MQTNASVHIRVSHCGLHSASPTFFACGRLTVEAEGMKVRLDAGDVVFLHKKAQVSNIDFKHSCVCNDPQEGGKLGVVHGRVISIGTIQSTG